jgi:NADH dehydrogenase FAD-containing subunit
MEPCERTDIVIVGGGFGGMNAALALDRRLKRGLRAEVTFISRSNFFLFTPLLVEVAAALVESRTSLIQSAGCSIGSGSSRERSRQWIRFGGP